MADAIRSLWLPVGRENFYSPMTDPALLLRSSDGTPTGTCQSDRYRDDPRYVPHLRESVLRRLLEVLPFSFGYRRSAECGFCDEPDEGDRPVSVTFTLPLREREIGTHGVPRVAHLAGVEATNEQLGAAGVERIVLRVDEQGFYTFVATHSGAQTERVEELLDRHVLAVFGGDFTVDRLSRPAERAPNEGVNAVRRYNGLPAVRTKSVAPEEYGDETPEDPPRGALSFHQLNILVEALCNASLLPAVFFEHYEESRKWLMKNSGRVSAMTEMETFLRAVMVGADARDVDGRTIVLRRFMVITRASLQSLTRSVESVRRSLLDKMMAVSHRRARLVQLDLGGIGYERTPELTGEASESQMRGYVVLVATKLPLIQNVSECAQATVRALSRTAGPAAVRLAESGDRDGIAARVHDLDQLTQHWVGLLRALREGVGKLNDAVAQDWQERLLYEQEQARSEQQAMAEIERSRRGLPDRRRTGEMAYNAVMLILTAVTVVAAIPVVNDPAQEGQSIWQRLLDLWPLFAGLIAITVLLGGWTWLRRHRRQRRPDSEVYGYEFAFRLDEVSSYSSIHRYLELSNPRRIRLDGFGRAKLRALGGWRTDKISPDTELVKVRSVVAVRLRRFGLRYARFEVVVEIIIRQISDQPEYFIRHCRVFGDSPRPIALGRLQRLVGQLVDQACRPMAAATNGNGTRAAGSQRGLDRLTALTHGIYTGAELPAPPMPIPQPRRPLDDSLTGENSEETRNPHR